MPSQLPASAAGRLTSDTLTGGLLLAALFAAPRVARFLAPNLWLEDAYYVYAAGLIEAGLRPYLDFSLTHPPWLEAGLGCLFGFLPTSYRTAEIVSQLAIYATTWLLYAAGRRLGGEAVGVLSGLAYACNSLVFRYHVFEREIFLNLFIAWILWIFTRPRPFSPRNCLFLLLAFAGGTGVKITMAIPAVSAALVPLVLWREPRQALAVLLLAAGGAVIALVPPALWYGGDFVHQVLVYHLVKGTDYAGAWNALTDPLRFLELPFCLGVLGIAVAAATGRRALLVLVLCFSLPWLLFLAFVSLLVWPHNYVPLLPPLALASGLFLSWAGGQLSTLVGRGGASRRNALVALLASAASFALLLRVAPIPWDPEDAIVGRHYGFGFVPRRELELLAEEIRRRTAPEDPVLVPDLLALQSGRRRLVRGWEETLGILKWSEPFWREGRLVEAWSDARQHSFTQMVRRTRSLWLDDVVETLASGRIPVVVPDDWNLPLAPAFLRRHGYRPVLKTSTRTLWALEDPASSRRPRPPQIR